MTALPSQTKASLSDTINTALSLPITHISAYSLIIEDGTPLEREYSKGMLILPNEDEDREMYADTVTALQNNGFHQYEISNFAKNGFECRHNKKYWQCEEYIGLGVAAHSYIDGKRFYNTSDLSEYIGGKMHTGDELYLTERDKIGEFMIMGLRMNVGISEAEFLKRFRKCIDDVYSRELEKFVSSGLLIRENGTIRFTDRGRDISNTVLCEFV
jgi:oxygen-independent coproporphyrinogen-3 oxidase